MPQHHFVIYFLGLIAHFGLPNANPPTERAVLVEHDHHTPFLFLREDDLDGSTPPASIVCPTAPGREAPFPGGGVLCYNLTNVHVTFSGLPGGLPASFDSHIPRLTTITNGTRVHHHINTANTGCKYASGYVDYTGGRVSAPALAEPKVRWSTPLPPRPGCITNDGPTCIAAYTAYEADHDSAQITMYLNGTPVKLKPDSQIVILNLADPSHFGPNHTEHPPDYKEHLELNDGICIRHMNRTTDRCNSDAAAKALTAAPLAFVGGVTIPNLNMYYNLEVECSQSQNPPP